jgi:hypothetical protein
MRIPDLYLERRAPRSLRGALAAHAAKTGPAGIPGTGRKTSRPAGGGKPPCRGDDRMGAIPLGPAGLFWVGYGAAVAVAMMLWLA